MKPADCHCHLDFEQFDKDRQKVINRAKQNLEFIVVAGSNIKHNKAALKLEKENPKFIKANLGLHPTYTESFDELDQIKQQIREKNPVAIGEIGLDHHHVKDEKTRRQQEEVFRQLLELAEELEKPVVIHSRDAERKAVKILKEYNLPNVMLHCFNGDVDLAQEATNESMKIGITTQVLYSSRVQSIASEIDLDDILLETDSPFLHRGDRNEPVNVLESAEKIAEIKGVGKSSVIKQTNSTASDIFD